MPTANAQSVLLERDLRCGHHCLTAQLVIFWSNHNRAIHQQCNAKAQLVCWNAQTD